MKNSTGRLVVLLAGAMGLVPLPLLQTDSYHGQPTTRDDSGRANHTALPSAASTLFPSDPPSAVAFSVVRSLIDPEAKIGSSRQNALLDVFEPFQAGFVYQIRFQETDFEKRRKDAIIGFGLSSPELYGSGWALQGAFIGTTGNLYTQGFLDSGFLRYYEGGTIIDLFVEVEAESHTVNLYVAQDNSPRGHAYKFEGCDPATIARLRPTVSFDENSSDLSVVVVQFGKKQIDLTNHVAYRDPPALEQVIPSLTDPVGIRGLWTGYLDEIRFSSEIQPDEGDPMLYSVNFHLVNFMRALWKVKDLETGSVETQEEIMSTFVGIGDPETNNMENDLKKAFTSVSKVVRISPSEVHAFYGPNPQQQVLVFKREPKNKEPQTSNPFC